MVRPNNAATAQEPRTPTSTPFTMAAVESISNELRVEHDPDCNVDDDVYANAVAQRLSSSLCELNCALERCGKVRSSKTQTAAKDSQDVPIAERELSEFERKRIGKLIADVLLNSASVSVAIGSQVGADGDLLSSPITNSSFPSRDSRSPNQLPQFDAVGVEGSPPHPPQRPRRHSDDVSRISVSVSGASGTQISYSTPSIAPLNNSLLGPMLMSVNTQHDSMHLRKYIKLVERLQRLISREDVTTEEFDMMQLRFVIPKLYPTPGLDGTVTSHSASMTGLCTPSGVATPRLPRTASSMLSVGMPTDFDAIEAGQTLLSEGAYELVENGAYRFVTLESFPDFRMLVREKVRELEGDFLEQLDARTITSQLPSGQQSPRAQMSPRNGSRSAHSLVSDPTAEMIPSVSLSEKTASVTESASFMQTPSTEMGSS